MVDYVVLGSRIQEKRRDRQMTQQQLAEQANLSDVYIGFIEQAKRRGSIDTFVRIVNALGCTLDDLFDGYLIHKAPPAVIDIVSLVSRCTPLEQMAIYDAIRALLNVIKIEREGNSLQHSTHGMNK